MIERLILTGLINSTEYLQKIRPAWDMRFLVSKPAQEIAKWCIDYYDEYQKAPERYIEDLFFEKKDAKEIPKDMVPMIEDGLMDLAQEYDENFNLEYAVKRTAKYFRERHLEMHQDAVRDLFQSGDIEAAEALATNYTGQVVVIAEDIDLGKEEVLTDLDHAFNSLAEPLIRYPGKLGEMLNDQLIRGGFVSILSPEKRGKSYWLLDMSMRATYNRCKVALFQAGDMTKDQQIKRISTYLTRLPSNEKYTGTTYIPVADCILNQLDECNKEERRCSFGPFSRGIFSKETMRREITREDLLEALEDYDDYKPCTNCSEFQDKPLGTPWLVPRKLTHAVQLEEAQKKVQTFFIERGRHFKISTHPNNTLSVGTIKNILARWEREDNFIPDVIAIDYADLLTAPGAKDMRDSQNLIWKDLRALSQIRDALVLTATQSDAKSYEKSILKNINFSEDKRKNAHVTFMFALNQDKDGREKKLGIMRLNTIVQREGEFDTNTTVTVLHNLNIGQPFLDSYI